MWTEPRLSRDNRPDIAASTSRLSSRPQTLLKRALSFQFLNKEDEFLTPEQKSYIRMRYKDTAKHVIWPSCRFDPSVLVDKKKAPLAPTDDRSTLFKAEIEDDRTPYLAATINDVLRSDSEDSSDAEELNIMTRL